MTWPGLIRRAPVMPLNGAVTRASLSNRRLRSTPASLAAKEPEAWSYSCLEMSLSRNRSFTRSNEFFASSRLASVSASWAASLVSSSATSREPFSTRWPSSNPISFTNPSASARTSIDSFGVTEPTSETVSLTACWRAGTATTCTAKPPPPAAAGAAFFLQPTALSATSRRQGRKKFVRIGQLG